MYIQVSYVSSQNEINRNEIRSLVKGSQITEFNKLTIVSWDLEDEITVEGKKIRIVPLWKYLL
ncbi:hypothetical protein [Sulfurisphaera ohwakuensis]|uniref:hypothetical protein n=1 Tax=Sulfurisphaera ohwakuensis TaxID=69656 RepID=UPI0036F42CBD